LPFLPKPLIDAAIAAYNYFTRNPKRRKSMSLKQLPSERRSAAELVNEVDFHMRSTVRMPSKCSKRAMPTALRGHARHELRIS